MSETFKENIKAYYAAYQLSSSQMLKLQSIQKRGVFSNSKRLRFRATWAQVSIAAALLILTFIFIKPASQPTYMDRLITEIAYNHNKNLDIEIDSNSIAEIRKYLSKLDFALIDSERLPYNTWNLIGGRYCSLQGQFAAQLKMQNKQTLKNFTVYQIKKPSNITDVSRYSEVFSNGVKVNLWLERGLLLALAGDS